jgi:hypothetical protein
VEGFLEVGEVGVSGLWVSEDVACCVEQRVELLDVRDGVGVGCFGGGRGLSLSD